MPSREREHGRNQSGGLKMFQCVMGHGGGGGLGEELQVQIGMKKATGLHDVGCLGKPTGAVAEQ